MSAKASMNFTSEIVDLAARMNAGGEHKMAAILCFVGAIAESGRHDLMTELCTVARSYSGVATGQSQGEEWPDVVGEHSDNS